MSVNAGQIGIGVAVAVDDGVGPSYVDMPDIQSIDFPEMPIQKAKKTVNSSTIEEYGPTIIDPDEMSITQLFDEEEYERNYDLKGVQRNYRVTFNDGMVYTVPGWMVSCMPVWNGLAEYTQMTCKIQLTGDVVIT